MILGGRVAARRPRTDGGSGHHGPAQADRAARASRTPDAAGAGGTPASDAIRALIDDMLATLEDANGVGIAAPQVYESAAIFIVASRPNPRYPDAPLMEPEVVINPEIVERSDELVKDWEGCLSIPGIRGDRPPASPHPGAVPDRRRPHRRAGVRRLRRPDLPARGRPPPRDRLPRPPREHAGRRHREGISEADRPAGSGGCGADTGVVNTNRGVAFHESRMASASCRLGR